MFFAARGLHTVVTVKIPSAKAVVSRNKLLQEVRGYAAALTIASAEKFLKKALDDTDKKRLVDESIEQVIQELEKRQRN